MKNIFDELKEEILIEYPYVKSLPLFARFKIWFYPIQYKSEVSISREKGSGVFRQSAVLVDYKGRSYVQRWGYLYN